MKNKLKQNKFILIINLFLLLSILFQPMISFADDFYGKTCGNTTCSGDETCQKTYRGILPIQEPNPTVESFLQSIVGSITGGGTTGVDVEPKWECVSPKRLEAPPSPYRGTQGCSEGISGLSGILGDTVSGLLGQGVLGSVFGGVNLVGFGSSLLGGPSAYTFIKPGGIAGGLVSSISDPLISQFRDLLGDGGAGFNGLINLNLNGDDECANYNNINTVIDTRRLTAPLPVDLFNPLPLPVNVTSPNPLPVVVVDDLALYQQKELVDAPLAAQQKAKTIGIISDNLRYQISRDSLIPDNYSAPTALGIQFGALDRQTGVVGKEAIDLYGSYANFELKTIDVLSKWYQDRQAQRSNLPPETFTEKCGNIKIAETGDKSLECSLLALYTNNNPNDLYSIVQREANSKSSIATSYINSALRDGRGYFPTTEGNSKNPFTNRILSPGAANQELATKVMQSTIDQAILSAGNKCYEALPQNILDGSLKPILTTGLYNVNKTLSSVLAPINVNVQVPGTTTPTTGTTTPTTGTTTNLINQILPGTTTPTTGTTTPTTTATSGTSTATTDLFQALGDNLLSNLTKGLSCELSNSLSTLLNSLIQSVIN